jgi:7-cyano-7-deazaguanine synthase
VPARNTIFLSLRWGWPRRGARDIYIGVNALDYSGYPDCRPEFIEAFEDLANLATKAGVEGDRFRVHAPLLHMTKADIAREAARLGLDAGMSWSCYDPAAGGGIAAVRQLPAARQGVRGGGLPDPTRLCRAAG